MANRPIGWLRNAVIAAGLIAFGVIGVWQLSAHRVLSGISEALIVAGVLTLAVDYFLKRDLLRQASEGIFVHLLGFEHRPEVKDKLKQIVFETKLLRKSFDVRCTIEPTEDGFNVTVEYDSEIINPTHAAVDFTPYMEFDMAHKVEVLGMSFTSSDGKYKWHGSARRDEHEPGVETFKPRHFPFSQNQRRSPTRATGGTGSN